MSPDHRPWVRGMTAEEVSDVELADVLPVRHPVLRRDRVLVSGLVVLAFGLWVPNLGRAYWVDEGISVGIASHPLSQLPGLLREDGSPPLFYVILHFWVRIFGTSPIATHLLPLLFALGSIPLAYWAGSELFDRRAGLVAAALFATNPFLAWYSTETRMYPMVIVISTIGITLAWKAVQERRWDLGVGAVVAYTALLYTHDWGIYLTGVTAAVLFGLAWSRRDRAMAAAIAAATGAVLVLWIPWLPTFIDQAHNTAAPWAVQPQVTDFFADQASALGGTLGIVVAPLLAGGVLWTRHLRQKEHGHLAGFLGAVGILTALAGWLGAQIEPSWTVRYLAVIVAPLLLGSAGALAGSRRGRWAVAAVCGMLVIWSAIGSMLPNPNAQYAKSNVAAVARAVTSQLHPGDVVVVTQTEQVAVLAHYLPRGLLYVTPTGPVSDPDVVNWRDLVHRLQVATPCAAVAPALDAMPVGDDLLLVNPARALGATGSAWAQAVRSQVVAVGTMINRDPSLVALASYENALTPTPFSPVDGVLFRKTTSTPACG